MAAVRARWMDLPRGRSESLSRSVASFLPLIHHHSTMRGYQYPLTDTDVGQLVDSSDRQRFHLGCRITVNGGNARGLRGK